MTSYDAGLLSDLLDLPRADLEAFCLRVETEVHEKETAGEIDPPPLFRPTLDPHPSGELVTVDPDDGTPVYHCHANQYKALHTHCRFLLVLAGWQSGKSSIGPPWLVQEMRRQGPGNYLAAAPSFKLLDKYPVPGISRLLGRILGLGEVVGGAMGEFRFSEAGHKRLWPESHWPKFDPLEPSRIIFGHADNPDSLASFTGKGAWLDEPGMKRFKQDSFEEVRGRLSTTGGRMLLTTRPYVHHWLKTDVYDRADRNRKMRRENKVREENGEAALPLNPADAGYEVVEFESIDNPRFKREEWESARLTMPAWKFDMKYRGRFTRPAGAIYDSFDPEYHVIPADYVPDPRWRIYCGIDFGAPNFAAVFIAEEPGTKKRIAFAEYRPQESKKIREHIDAMHKVMRRVFHEQAKTWAMMANREVADWTRLPDLCVGGAKSEGQWRTEFAAMGWPIREPDQPDVEVGISRVYSCFTTAKDSLFISAACPLLIADVQDYSREVDDDGEPISDTIADKDTFHGADSLRYIVSYLEAKGTGVGAWSAG
jgi:hypothetical protein